MKRMIDDSVLFGIAEAIREKNGTEDKYQDVEMAQAVRDIQANKEEQEKTVSISENGNYKVLPDENKVLSKVEVNVDVASNVGVSWEGRYYVKNVVLPDTLTRIGEYAFKDCGIQSISLPSALTTIDTAAMRGTPLLKIDFSVCKELTTVGKDSFYSCSKLVEVDFSENQKLKAILASAFYKIITLKVVKLPPNLQTLEQCVFQNCRALETLYLPNSISNLGWKPLHGCDALKYVYMGDGFNTNNFDLSNSTLYSVETIVSWGEALYDRTGLDPYTLIIGPDNIVKLSDEQIAIFTNKNWTLA